MTVFKLNSKIRNNNNRNHNPIICLTSLVLDRETGNTIKKSLIVREENCPPSSFNHAQKNLIPILWLHQKKKKKKKKKIQTFKISQINFKPKKLL